MQVLGFVDTHLEFAGNNILAELQDTFFHICRIFSIFHILDEVLCVYLACLIVTFQHQQSLVVLVENAIHVDTHEDLDVLHVIEFLTQFEITITGRTEISDHGKEGIEIRHTLRNTLEFIKEGVLRIVVKELAAHILMLCFSI